MKCCKSSRAVVGGLGLIAVLVFTLAWFFAAQCDPLWVFGSDTLSRLGVSDTDAKYFFNYGCMIGGALFALFGAGIAIRNYSLGSQISGILLSFSGVMLIGIGMFVLTSDYHLPILYALIVFTLSSIVAMTISDWTHGKVLAGGIAATVLIVCFLYVPVAPSKAASETVIIILGLIWIATQSVKILRE